jgi:hypothetical protein
MKLEVDRRHDRAKTGAGEKARHNLRTLAHHEAHHIPSAHPPIREEGRKPIHLCVQFSPAQTALRMQKRGLRSMLIRTTAKELAQGHVGK